MIDLSKSKYAYPTFRYPGIYWYTIGHQSIFPVYDVSGGPPSCHAMMAIKELREDFSGDLGPHGLHVGEDGKWFSMYIPSHNDPDEKDRLVEECLNILNAA